MKSTEDELDDWLMARAADGDAAAFDRIVQRHQHRIQRYAGRMLGGDAAMAADIAVGSFLRLWESRRSYRPCGKLGAWLLQVTHRMCLDSLAQNRGSIAFEDATVPVAGHGFEQAALADAVRVAVMELSEDHRSVLILSVYEEMSYDEIAEALCIPPGTVASRKNHAIAILRRRLAPWET